MSVNVHNDIDNHYYSGQGVVSLGQRDAVTGKPKMLLALGNVSDLKIMIATSVIDHKNSQDGQRAIDKRLQTETKCTASLTLENWVAVNLASALRGANTNVVAGTVTAEVITAWGGSAINPLQYINVASLVLTQATAGFTAGAMTEYVDDATPWDFKWNPDAGSFRLNSGTETIGVVKAGIPLTGTPAGTITTGVLAITSLTAWQTGIVNPVAVGDRVSLWGVTGAGAATVNGIAGTVTAVTATTLSISIPGSAGVVTLATTTMVVPIFDVTSGLGFSQTISAAYTYSAQTLVNSLTLAPQELYLRFEGLNTAETINGTFAPVVIEIFRFSSDPLKELAMISDAFGQFTLEGSVLADGTRPSGTSKYFNVKKLN
jgi:hypothetical protein